MSLPLILGSARPFLWGFIASVFLAGFALLILTSGEISGKEGMRKQQAGRRNGKFAWLPERFNPHWLFVAIIAYPFFQVVPLPLPLIRVLSPHRAQWLQKAMEATGRSRWWASLSYVPTDTVARGLWILTLLLFALLLDRCLKDGTIGLGGLLGVLSVIAGCEALYGLLQVLVPSTGLGFQVGCATGTFANYDHYAAFLGMIWPLQLVWLWRMGAKDGENKASSFEEREWRRNTREKQVFFLFLTGIVLLGLIFSESRGGIIALAVGMTVLAYLGGKGSKSVLLILIACWAIILIYGSIIGFGNIIERFMETARDAPGRFKIWQFTLKMIRDHWLTGTGVGTYHAVIFVYQFFDTDRLQIFAAHNDYLQTLSDWGLPFGLTLIALVWGYWWSTAIGIWRQKAGEKNFPGADERLIRIGALAGSASLLAHCWVEFNMRIPANQLYFVILLVLMSYRRGEAAHR